MHNDFILLVDDEKGILDMLELLLKKEGYQNIFKASTGEAALRYVELQPCDLIVLDVMLPDINGFELCGRLRLHTNAPVLFVTARSSDLDKIMGLSVGGDDYITKPFHPIEVAARIHAQLRRQKMYRQTMQLPTPGRLEFETFSIIKESGQLLVKGKEVHVTAKEFELICFLCERPNRIFTVQQIYEHVWGEEALGDEKTVVIHMTKLRKKIEDDPKNPKILVNIRGIGYKFVRSPEGR